MWRIAGVQASGEAEQRRSGDQKLIRVAGRNGIQSSLGIGAALYQPDVKSVY